MPLYAKDQLSCTRIPTNLETHTKDPYLTYIKCSLGYTALALVSNIMLLLHVNVINLVWNGSSMTFETSLLFFLCPNL